MTVTKLDVWVWCAYMMSVEEDEIVYAYPRPDGWEESSAECARGREAFYDAAVRANGGPLKDGQWRDSMAKFYKTREDEG
jgi:hypothetical protein